MITDQLPTQPAPANRRDRFPGLGSAVVFHRAEQRAALVPAMTGGGEVIMNERVRRRMQRQIPRLAALAGYLKSKRDRAILSALLFHALRREELCKLTVMDFRRARKSSAP